MPARTTEGSRLQKNRSLCFLTFSFFFLLVLFEQNLQSSLFSFLISRGIKHSFVLRSFTSNWPNSNRCRRSFVLFFMLDYFFRLTSSSSRTAEKKRNEQDAIVAYWNCQNEYWRDVGLMSTKCNYWQSFRLNEKQRLNNCCVFFSSSSKLIWFNSFSSSCVLINSKKQMS